MKTSATRKQPSAPEPSNARVGRTAQAAEILGRQPAATSAPERVPARWRWHHQVLLSLFSRLSRERGELRRVAAEPLEPHSLNEADSATDEFDHDLALTQLSADQSALYEVNEALQRIARGRYGRCEATGRGIPAARLRAVPWTRFTREVEERLEKQGVAPRAHLGKAATVRGKGRIRLSPEVDAEEVEAAPSAPPKDEALSTVFSPPGRHAARPRLSRLPSRATKPKGRNP